MEPHELHALQHGVITLLNNSTSAAIALRNALEDVVVGDSAPMVMTQVIQKPEPYVGQDLFVVCHVNLTTLRHLGHLLAEVVHPLRVAKDRIERNKRVLGLSASVWPPKSPLWGSIAKIDNFAKHEDPPHLFFLPEAVETAVYTADRKTWVADLEVTLSPFRVEPDVAMYKIVDSLPAGICGPEYAYGSRCTFSFRFGSKLGIVSNKPVGDFLDDFLAAGHGLLPVVGYPR